MLKLIIIRKVGLRQLRLALRDRPRHIRVVKWLVPRPVLVQAGALVRVVAARLPAAPAAAWCEYLPAHARQLAASADGITLPG